MYFIVASTNSSTGMPHHLPVHMLALRSRHTTSRYFLCANHRVDLGDISSAKPVSAVAAIATDAVAPLPPLLVCSEESFPVAPGMLISLVVLPLLLLLLLRNGRAVAARLDPGGGGGA